MRKVLEVREPQAAYAAQPQAARSLHRVNATEAKNRFGNVLARVERGEAVAISRHNATTAVILPADEYERLKNAASQRLNLLSDEFDALLERMQEPGAKSAMQRAFDTSPRLALASTDKKGRRRG